MKRTFVCFLLAVVTAAIAMAADATGKWTGSFTPENGDTQSALLVLKQNGTAITGTAGPDEGEQWPIRVGKIEGNKVTVEVQSEDGVAVYRCELVLDGDHMKGDLTATRGDQTMKAKMDVSRVK